jgi:hypothetical protein
MAGSASPPRRGITWDEANISEHDAKRGIEFGTMKIDQPETPFLYLNSESASRGELCSGKGPALNGVLDGPPPKVTIEDMQKALGVLEEAETAGADRFADPKFASVEGDGSSFEERRAALYRGEKLLAALAEGLPSGWTVLMSRSTPHEPYYRNDATEETTWDRPSDAAPPAALPAL